MTDHGAQTAAGIRSVLETFSHTPKAHVQSFGCQLNFCDGEKYKGILQDLGYELIKVLGSEYPDMLKERYRLDEISEDALENMDNIARKRGFILSGNRIDYERTARAVLDEFRGGKIGRITLEYVK